MRAKDIMTTPAVCVRPSTPIAEVAAILSQRGFCAVPVVEEGDRLVGLVTETDLIRERFGLHPQSPTSGRDRQPKTVAAQVMTSPVEFVRPEATLSALAKCMISGRRRSMPVVDGIRVVGMVTRRDVVETMARTDDVILAGVRKGLERAGLRQRWLVRVQAGVVHLFGDTDLKNQHEATLVAESVPGVIRVTVTGPPRTGLMGSGAVNPAGRRTGIGLKVAETHG